MGQNAEVVYDRRSGKDRRNNEDTSSTMQECNNKEVVDEKRFFGDRRRTEGLEISSADIADDEFEEVFKQFQKIEPVDGADGSVHALHDLDIVDYKVLYRKGVECAYITILLTDAKENEEPSIYVFPDNDKHSEVQSENKPTHVQNIFGMDAYQNYLEQGWDDISKSENIFPWPIKAWLAQNMKQDTI